MRRLTLWVIAALLGLTAAANLLGGLGTSCVAFFAERFGERMALLAPYKWLYVAFVVAGTATGVYEAWSASGVARGTAREFRQAVASLLAGAVVAGAQAMVSSALRGSGAPADMRAYLSLAVLAIVLAAGGLGVFRSGREDGPAPDEAIGAGGAALMAAGALALAAPLLMRATHTLDGVDHARAWGWALPVAGAAAIAAGTSLLAFVAERSRKRNVTGVTQPRARVADGTLHGAREGGTPREGRHRDMGGRRLRLGRRHAPARP